MTKIRKTKAVADFRYGKITFFKQAGCFLHSENLVVLINALTKNLIEQSPEF